MCIRFVHSVAAAFLASAMAVTGCAAKQPSVSDVECSAIRAFYDRAQSELIDRGVCDNADSVSQCIPHVALREVFIASLKDRECKTVHR